MTLIRPARLQLSRRRGFRLQEHSLATNGLPAVKVDRSTKWGNPFRVGEKSPYGTIVADRRHAWGLYLGFAPINAKLVAAAQAELCGKNLACWCGREDSYQDVCHAAVLLDIANGTAPPPATAAEDGAL